MLFLLPFLALSTKFNRDSKPYLTTHPNLTRNPINRILRTPLPDLFLPNDLFDDFTMVPAISKNFMPLEVKELDQGYEFSMDLPGIPKENIDISISDHVMTVKAERRSSFEEGEPDDQLEDEQQHDQEDKHKQSHDKKSKGSGSKALDKVNDKVIYHRSEVYYGAVARSFTLPKDVNEDDIGASYENGVLTIHIAKHSHHEEQKKRKKITIS